MARRRRFICRSALIGEVVGLYDAVRRQRQDIAVVRTAGAGAAGAGGRVGGRCRRGAHAAPDAVSRRDVSRLPGPARGAGRPRRTHPARVADDDAAGAALPAGALSPSPTRPATTTACGAPTSTCSRGCPMWKPSRSSPPRPCSPPAGSSACTTCCPDLPRVRPHATRPRGQTPTASFWSGLTRRACWCPPDRRRRSAGLGSDPKPFFVSRDREEELRDLVRRIRTLQRDERTRVPLGRIGVVFDRPLPYVYLAREVFAQGGVPFDARDALPLGAEPFAAAVDLVLSCAAAAFSRPALIALLASPHFRFAPHDGERADRSARRRRARRRARRRRPPRRCRSPRGAGRRLDRRHASDRASPAGTRPRPPAPPGQARPSSAS